jgi:hypothetical protein
MCIPSKELSLEMRRCQRSLQKSPRKSSKSLSCPRLWAKRLKLLAWEWWNGTLGKNHSALEILQDSCVAADTTWEAYLRICWFCIFYFSLGCSAAGAAHIQSSCWFTYLSFLSTLHSLLLPWWHQVCNLKLQTVFLDPRMLELRGNI